MDEPNPQDIAVFRYRSHGACMESRLVLEATGIASQWTREGNEWLLTVDHRDADAAEEQIAAYQQDQTSLPASIKRRGHPVFSGSVWGILSYIFVLVSIATISSSPESKPIWLDIGQMKANGVMSGQLYRCLTALTLHADAGHLLSNLVFGSVFGLLVGRILGGGIAWLSIITAGFLGNLLNAALQNPNHASIGASTAVFSALGVMVAHALHSRSSEEEKLFARWAPVIGGVLLLSFIGVGGERTDVGAHLYGFFAGIPCGWLACRLPDRLLGNKQLQVATGILAIALISAAWAIGIFYSTQSA